MAPVAAGALLLAAACANAAQPGSALTLEKVMADPRLEALSDPSNHPFDGKRMIIGGFETTVEL